MLKHSKIGNKGEQIAQEFLEKKGYLLLYNNWRTGNKEVDIVMAQEDTAIFVEVKARTSQALYYPEETVNKTKQRHLRQAAMVFREKYPAYKHLRFDIVSILFNADVVKEIVHFPEAFH